MTDPYPIPPDQITRLTPKKLTARVPVPDRVTLWHLLTPDLQVAAVGEVWEVQSVTVIDQVATFGGPTLTTAVTVKARRTHNPAPEAP